MSIYKVRSNHLVDLWHSTHVCATDCAHHEDSADNKDTLHRIFGPANQRYDAAPNDFYLFGHFQSDNQHRTIRHHHREFSRLLDRIQHLSTELGRFERQQLQYEPAEPRFVQLQSVIDDTKCQIQQTRRDLEYAYITVFTV